MKKILIVFSTLILCLFVTFFSGCSKTTYADTVIYGNIYTSNTNSDINEAMAISNGKIIACGSKSDVKKYIGSNTVEKNESFVMPGFIDGHCHIYVQAENQQGFILTGKESKTGNPYDGYLSVIRDYIEEHPNMDVYKGFGWLDNAFIGITPTAKMLDEICSTKPIYIKSEDCHSCWVNTKMMELAGITQSTANPIGGVIEHDSSGNPNGCFRDTAMDYLIKPYVPLYTISEYESMLQWAQNYMIQSGYTAYNDVIIDPQSAENICKAYHKLDQEGKLKAKVNAAILINNTDKYLEALNNVISLKSQCDGTNFKITDVKIFMDGIVESETAYVSEPYTDGKMGADRWTGVDGTNRLNDLTKRINEAGLVAHFHAIGDAAIGKALDAIAYAKSNITNDNIRNCITHLQMITQSQIQRMKSLDVIAVSNLGWAPSQDESTGATNIEKINVGEERNNAMYPFKSILDNGVKMSYATDFPAGPISNPIYNIEAGVTRQIGSISSTLRNANERITIYQALNAITSGGAYQLYREDTIGSLEVGKDADFICLSENLTTIDPYKIYSNVSLKSVYIKGELLYSA